MSRINWLCRSIIPCRQGKHRSRNFILAFRRKPTHGLECLFKEFCHRCTILLSGCDWKVLARFARSVDTYPRSSNPRACAIVSRA
jgi:hypothetical protein